jgi:hypothetical protein
MTYYGVGASSDYISYDRGRLSQKILSLTIPGAAALALSLVAGFWMLYVRPAASPIDKPSSVARAVLPPALPPLRAGRTAKASNTPNKEKAPAGAQAQAILPPVLTPVRSARRNVAANPYGTLLDPQLVSDSPPQLAQSAPLSANFVSAPLPPGDDVTADHEVAERQVAEREVAEPEKAELTPPTPKTTENIPMPTPRPAELAAPAPIITRPSLRQFAETKRADVATAAKSDDRSVWDKLFGARQSSSGPVLAYASPQDGLLGSNRRITGGPSGSYDQGTAVYDIAAHTVYMPDGTKLEAHSGLGSWIDDPRHVNEKMRGATPPNVYALEPRGELFHGVQALRLIPAGNGQGYGRVGLLAHTYMLGPNGQSNGCVSFRNYQAFLQAYMKGEVKRLVVVASLN